MRQAEIVGFDHGVGHPLLLLCNAKAHNCRNNKSLEGLWHYFEWPKVADAVIEAPQFHVQKFHHPSDQQSIPHALPRMEPPSSKEMGDGGSTTVGEHLK